MWVELACLMREMRSHISSAHQAEITVSWSSRGAEKSQGKCEDSSLAPGPRALMGPFWVGQKVMGSKVALDSNAQAEVDTHRAQGLQSVLPFRPQLGSHRPGSERLLVPGQCRAI